MPRRPQGVPPAYRLHKARNLAVVTIDGKDHYLGSFGSPESHQRYGALIYGDGPPSSSEKPQAQAESSEVTTVSSLPQRSEVLVGELTLAYFEKHAVHYYRSHDESPGRLPVVQAALRAINQPYAQLPARRFGPLRLEKVRERLIRKGLKRVYINELISLIVAAFKWSASQQMISFRAYQQLTTLAPLKKGRSAAAESQRVLPVEKVVTEKTATFLSPTLQAMVQLQLLTGARPGEVRRLRPCDIERLEDQLWCYKPPQHKNLHRGYERRIYLGPRAQAILMPFLDREPNAYCFSPRETVAWQNAQRAIGKKNQSRRQPCGISERIKTYYTKDAYRRAIERACKRAKVAVWSPHRLRHSAATEMRRVAGIQGSRVALGVADVQTAEIYAERDFTDAAKLAKKFG